jgi:NTP pyrophosphatase (non-canonical NTP hydrolase)
MTDKDLRGMYSGFVDRMVVPDFMGDFSSGNYNVPNKLRHIHRAASGMTCEAGELLEITHKAIYRGHKWEMAYLIQEAGDVMFFLQAFCNAVGITLEELAQANIVKLSQRYPDGYCHDVDVERSEV